LVRCVSAHISTRAGAVLVECRCGLIGLLSHFASGALYNIARLRDGITADGRRLAGEVSSFVQRLAGSCLNIPDCGLALIEFALKTCPRLLRQVIGGVFGLFHRIADPSLDSLLSTDLLPPWSHITVSF